MDTKKKILIIDDEPGMVEMLETRLLANGYDVLKAYESIQALRLAYEKKPDLILLDYKIPGGDGVSIYEKLKASTFTEKTPVIFITGYPDDRLKEMVLYMDAIRKGEPVPVSGRDGLIANIVIDGVFESARTGQVVKLDY